MSDQQEETQEGKAAKGEPFQLPPPWWYSPPGGPCGTAEARARRVEAAIACFMVVVVVFVCGLGC